MVMGAVFGTLNNWWLINSPYIPNIVTNMVRLGILNASRLRLSPALLGLGQEKTPQNNGHFNFFAELKGNGVLNRLQ